MHKIIRVIVKGNDEEEARENAENMVNDLAERNKYGIDYGSFFFEKDSSVSGIGRWGNMPPIVPLRSKQGAKYVLQALLWDFTDFKESLKKVEDLIKKSPTDLFSAGFELYHFEKVYEREWVLFEHDMIGPRELRYIVEHEWQNKYWVLPCDVHT